MWTDLAIWVSQITIFIKEICKLKGKDIPRKELKQKIQVRKKRKKTQEKFCWEKKVLTKVQSFEGFKKKKRKKAVESVVSVQPLASGQLSVNETLPLAKRVTLNKSLFFSFHISVMGITVAISRGYGED